MKVGVSQLVLPVNVWQRFPWSQRFSHRQPRVHVYGAAAKDLEYVIEPMQQEGAYLMTAQGTGVRSGDYVVLKAPEGQDRYQVAEVDFYSGGLPDLWTAKLLRVVGSQPIH